MPHPTNTIPPAPGDERHLHRNRQREREHGRVQLAPLTIGDYGPVSIPSPVPPAPTPHAPPAPPAGAPAAASVARVDLHAVDLHADGDGDALGAQGTPLAGPLGTLADTPPPPPTCFAYGESADPAAPAAARPIAPSFEQRTLNGPREAPAESWDAVYSAAGGFQSTHCYHTHRAAYILRTFAPTVHLLAQHLGLTAETIAERATVRLREGNPHHPPVPAAVVELCFQNEYRPSLYLSVAIYASIVDSPVHPYRHLAPVIRELSALRIPPNTAIHIRELVEEEGKGGTKMLRVTGE